MIKEAVLCLNVLRRHFLVVLHHKIYVFIIFIALFFFDKVSKFCSKVLTNRKRKLVAINCLWNYYLIQDKTLDFWSMINS